MFSSILFVLPVVELLTPHYMGPQKESSQLIH
jgi:hypothetical protein